MPNNWETRYERDGEIPLVDMVLLEAIEKNPEDYFKNSYHNCKTFLAQWASICEWNIQIIDKCAEGWYTKKYLKIEQDTLKRIQDLQNKWIREE